MARSTERTYKRAVELLNSRRRSQRQKAGTQNANPTNGTLWRPGATQRSGVPGIYGMQEWLSSIDCKAESLDALNPIHVAGTKGKGSTCAFIESFLRAHGRRTGSPIKTGLYTSPHLIYPEERIRINFEPISRQQFASSVFDVWETLTRSVAKDDVLPGYLQLMALVAFYVFKTERVDAAIVETHHGGEYDATNVLHRPAVTVITPLGMDHVRQLGPTIEDIAWHKAGIFKSGAIALASPHELSVSKVLRSRAAEKGSALTVQTDETLVSPSILQNLPDAQRQNCNLAIAATRSFLQVQPGNKGQVLSDADIEQGIRQFEWPGRFQTIVEKPNVWYLDGAHNDMSMRQAAAWYLKSSEKKPNTANPRRILLFGQVSEQRDALDVFQHLTTALRQGKVDDVILTWYDPDDDFEGAEVRSASPEYLSLLGKFAQIWQNEASNNSRVFLKANVPAAMETVKDLTQDSAGAHIFVTGSQHLVGSVLYHLGRTPSGSS